MREVDSGHEYTRTHTACGRAIGDDALPIETLGDRRVCSNCKRTAEASMRVYGEVDG